MQTTTIAGRTWNFTHSVGCNGMAGRAFTQPIDLALAPGGVIYVVSRGRDGLVNLLGDGKRIGKVNIEEEYLGDFGQDRLIWPAGLATDGDGNVYCSDEYRNIIESYDPDGLYLSEWGGHGSDEGQIDGPSGLAFDAEDNLYVVDARNHRVQSFTRDGQFLTAWGGRGSGEGQFNLPWGITVDGKGDVYVADSGNNRVQKFSPDGLFLMSFGTSGEDGGDLSYPADVGVDSEGDVYVSDFGNRRVQIYDSKGDILTALYGDVTEFNEWAKEVVVSNPDVVKAYRRVHDRSLMARFNRPRGIAVDEQDRVIVVDSNPGRLQVYAKLKEYLDPQFNL